jgi:hypothetical protein
MRDPRGSSVQRAGRTLPGAHPSTSTCKYESKKKREDERRTIAQEFFEATVSSVKSKGFVCKRISAQG